MAKYLKLGKKASSGSFSDPTLNLNISPGQVVQAPNTALSSQSKVFNAALQHGHIVEATEEEFNEYNKNAPTKSPTIKSKTKKDEPKSEIDGETDKKKSPSKMTKNELLEVLRAVDQDKLDEDLYDDYDDDFEDLGEKKHGDLVALYKKYVEKEQE